MRFAEELPQRKKRLAKWLKEKQFGAAVFLKEEIELVNGDFVYYGGAQTSGEYAAIIVDSEENSYAIVHEYSFERVEKSGLYDHVYEIRQSLDQLILALKKLEQEKVKEEYLAIDFGTISATTLKLIRDSGIEAEDNSLMQFVHSERALKSRYEILEMDKAIGVAKRSFEKTLDSLKVGQRISDVVRVLSKNMVEEEALPSFEIDIRFRSNLKDRETNTLRRGDMVLFDFGARLHSMYLSDVGRTVPFGPASKDTTDFLEKTASIKREGLKNIRSGMNGNSVREAIDRLIEEHGYVSTHRPGHQIGINVHEPYGPHLAYGPENSGLLQDGNVVTWEPGIGFKETEKPKNRFGMAHMEDMVLVGQNSKILGGFDLEYW